MTALESEEVSGLSGTDGSELELLPSDGRDDEESVSDDGSGTVIVLSEDADDEFCDELDDGFFTVDEFEDGLLTEEPVYQSFFSTPLAAI